jgi:hypothetical protein
MQRTRTRIAQVTARLIAEHGLSDWSAAKRKACRELGLPEEGEWPGNDEVEQALHEYNSLFRPHAQAASLREQRTEALRWLELLKPWKPILTGAVAAGWATPHSDLALELEADEGKEVEFALLNAGIRYGPGAGSRGGEASLAQQLRIDDGSQPVRLTIMTPAQRRNRSKRVDEVRLNERELRALLAADDSEAAD